MDYSKYCNSAPMQTFYGDSHEEICVEYNFRRNPLFEHFCLHINYVGNANNYTLTRQLIDKINPSRRLLLEIFVKKSQSWSYEGEW